MNGEEPTLYIKASISNEVYQKEVYLCDVIDMECIDTTIIHELEKIMILKFSENEPYKVVISILNVIHIIHTKFPNLTIECMGAEDIIVKYNLEKKQNKLLSYIKVTVVSIIIFIGAAYSIIAFSNDVDTDEILAEVYFQATGEESNGYTIIEISYCIGLVLGILVFFNHYGRRDKESDPNPMLIDMRKYEENVEMTLIQSYSRRNKEVKNDCSDHSSNHRSG